MPWKVNMRKIFGMHWCFGLRFQFPSKKVFHILKRLIWFTSEGDFLTTVTDSNWIKYADAKGFTSDLMLPKWCGRGSIASRMFMEALLRSVGFTYILNFDSSLVRGKKEILLWAYKKLEKLSQKVWREFSLGCYGCKNSSSSSRTKFM